MQLPVRKCWVLVPVPFVILLLLPGCSGRSRNPGHEFITRTEEGMVTAVNRGGPRFTEPIFRFEEVLELREDPGNEASFLYRPRGFVQDEAGRFYVNDYGNRRIAVFDASGAFSRGMGRAGEGPGEFRYLFDLQVEGGIVQAFDHELNRLTRFRTDGTLLDVVTLGTIPVDLGLGNVLEGFLTPDERLVLRSQQDIPDPDFQISRNRLVVLDAEHRLLWETATPEYKHVTWAVFRGRRGLGVMLPFPRTGSISFQPEQGVLVSPGDAPILLRYDLDGNVVRRIRLELEARPFTAGDRSRVLQDYDRRIAEASEATAEQLRATKEALIFPEFWPWWEGAGLDDAGRIWLGTAEHGADRETAGGGTFYKVLDPRGEYLGDARVPPLRYTRFSRGRLLGQRTDPETGAEHLVVFRIVPAVAGLKYPD
jgi:hypothetical protein